MGTASTKKFIKNNAGTLTEEAALITSAGAADANRIPALNASGVLDHTIIINGVSVSTGAGSASKTAMLDASGKMARVLSAATTNATLVKSSAGNLYGIWVSNTSASNRWLKLYNMTTAPTVGSSVPVMTIAIPSGFCGDLNVGTHGISFATGISLAITGAYTDADTTAIAAGDVCLNILYK